MSAHTPTETTTYSVEFDPETGEYVANADGQIYTSNCGPLAYHWLSAQIVADETDAPGTPATQ